MLADAAVVGKVFWAGALAAMGERDPPRWTDALRELSRKELVRPARRSSIAGEAEYAFWHVLTRDVAYSQLPRASRASGTSPRQWIESKRPSGSRTSPTCSRTTTRRRWSSPAPPGRPAGRELEAPH